MTTNIFDKARNVLSSDSRWSFQLREGHFSHGSDRNVIPCVDNTGYDKKSAIPTPDLRGQDQNPLMNVGKSTGMPRRSIVSACALDVYSGGEVKFLQGRETLRHNLQTDTPFSAINALFLTQGMVIYMNQNQGQTAIPIGQAAQQDPRIKDLVERVKVGAVSATAPSGFDPVVWTPADHARLDQALEDRAKRRALKAKT